METIPCPQEGPHHHHLLDKRTKAWDAREPSGAAPRMVRALWVVLPTPNHPLEIGNIGTHQVLQESSDGICGKCPAWAWQREGLGLVFEDHPLATEELGPVVGSRPVFHKS